MDTVTHWTSGLLNRTPGHQRRHGARGPGGSTRSSWSRQIRSPVRHRPQRRRSWPAPASPSTSGGRRPLNDQAWVESFFDHLTGEFRRRETIRDPGELAGLTGGGGTTTPSGTRVLLRHARRRKPRPRHGHPRRPPTRAHHRPPAAGCHPPPATTGSRVHADAIRGGLCRARPGVASGWRVGQLAGVRG